MASPTDQKIQELISQNQDINAKLLEYCDHNAKTNNQISQDLDTFIKQFDNLEKSIQKTITNAIV
jgi:uncharacterized protein YllA (UPF0747 family)